MELWGTVPDWIAALGTIGALLAAVLAGTTAKRLFDVESRRDDDRELANRREQARHVAAWVAAAIGPHGEAASYGLVVQNSSDAVIYDVMIESTRKNSVANDPARLQILPPGSYFVAAQDGRAHAWAFAQHLDAIAQEVRPITKSSSIRITHLTFRDSADVRWERSDSGVLTEHL